MRSKNPRTIRICETKNISFPIGSIAVVKKYFTKLGLSKVFGRGINLSWANTSTAGIIGLIRNRLP